MGKAPQLLLFRGDLPDPYRPAYIHLGVLTSEDRRSGSVFSLIYGKSCRDASHGYIFPLDLDQIARNDLQRQTILRDNAANPLPTSSIIASLTFNSV